MKRITDQLFVVYGGGDGDCGCWVPPRYLPLLYRPLASSCSQLSSFFALSGQPSSPSLPLNGTFTLYGNQLADAPFHAWCSGIVTLLVLPNFADMLNDVVVPAFCSPLGSNASVHQFRQVAINPSLDSIAIFDIDSAATALVPGAIVSFESNFAHSMSHAAAASEVVTDSTTNLTAWIESAGAVPLKSSCGVPWSTQRGSALHNSQSSSIAGGTIFYVDKSVSRTGLSCPSMGPDNVAVVGTSTSVLCLHGDTILWKVPVGGGIQSCPAIDVSGRRVFVQSKMAVYALDLDTGAVIWQIASLCIIEYGEGVYGNVNGFYAPTYFNGSVLVQSCFSDGINPLNSYFRLVMVSAATGDVLCDNYWQCMAHGGYRLCFGPWSAVTVDGNSTIKYAVQMMKTSSPFMRVYSWQAPYCLSKGGRIYAFLSIPANSNSIMRTSSSWSAQGGVRGGVWYAPFLRGSAVAPSEDMFSNASSPT